MCFTQNFWTLLVQGLANGFLYALIALGYTLVYGVLQLINFAHSEVFMSGGFAGYFVLNAWVGNRQPTGLAEVGYAVVGIVAGALAGGAVAFLLERVAYRPLRRRRAPKLAFLISAIGASYFIYNLAGKEFGRDAVELPVTFSGTMFTVLGAQIQTYYVLIAASALAMLVFLDRVVALTKLGRGIRAVAQDAETASLMGVNIDRVISQAFVLGGLLGGAAGFLFGINAGVVYTMGFTPALKAFTAAVLGGIGNLRGAMLGGLLLGVAENLPSGCIAASWRDVVAFAILVLVLLVRPTGLLGERFRRGIGSLLGFLALAVMTGPSGSASAPLSGFRGSLLNLRIFWFIGYAIALWLVWTVRIRYREAVRSLSDWISAAPKRLVPNQAARYGVYMLALAFAIVYPQFLSAFWQEVAVQQIGVYVLLAIGLNVVVGYAGLLDLGYVAFYAIGAYSAAYWTGVLPFHPPFVINMFWAIPLAILAAMLAGVVLGAPTLRLRGDYLAIVTLGFGEIIEIVANNLTGVTGGAQGALGIPHFSINLVGIHYAWGIANLPYYYLLLGFVVIILIVFRSLEHSRVGRAWTAIREDEVAAESSGINVLKYKVMAFAIGASTSGFAGLLTASQFGYINPGDFTVQLSITILVLVIFGGMGSLPGAVVGAAVIQWFPQFLRLHPLFGFQQQDLYIYLGALLVVMMIFRPAGIIPSRRRRQEIGLTEHGVGTADAMSEPAGEVA
jgi:ABC-type branched-subunit amino acid transport system permease subunit